LCLAGKAIPRRLKWELIVSFTLPLQEETILNLGEFLKEPSHKDLRPLKIRVLFAILFRRVHFHRRNHIY